MSRPTIASLQGDLAATTNALNTYVALHNDLANKVDALNKVIARITAAVQHPHRRVLSKAEHAAATKAFFDAHPNARSATAEQLLQYAAH